MPCLTEKLGVGSSLTGLAGSGVIAVLGAPTVVLAVAGATVAVGALVGAIASLRALQECYARHDKMADADKVAQTIEQLQAEVADLRARFGIA